MEQKFEMNETVKKNLNKTFEIWETTSNLNMKLRALSLRNHGKSLREVAEIFGVSKDTVNNWTKNSEDLLKEEAKYPESYLGKFEYKKFLHDRLLCLSKGNQVTLQEMDETKSNMEIVYLEVSFGDLEEERFQQELRKRGVDEQDLSGEEVNQITDQVDNQILKEFPFEEWEKEILEKEYKRLCRADYNPESIPF